MGQRTQMLIVKEKKDGETQKKLYHFQWGYGRCMFFELMQMLIADSRKDTFDKNLDFFDLFKPMRATDISEDEASIDNYLENVDPADIQSVKKLFDCCDNNNGGMVVYVKEPKDKYDLAIVKFYMLFGAENIPVKKNGQDYEYELIEEPFSRRVDHHDWMESSAGMPYTDSDFQTMFDIFIDNFNCVDWLTLEK